MSSQFEQLKVDLGDRSYPISIGSGLLNLAEQFEPYIKGKQVMIVTNDTIEPIYGDRLRQTLSQYDVETVILPDGEQYKNWETLNLIFDALMQARHDRTTTIVALGGGVVGDMAGYAAASYQRGVAFVQVPTTLLSQVDSSVGGKTGINHPMGKNMIGAFYQPQAVVIDTDSLNTLPKREVSAGIAEIIKYGLIRDPEFYDWLSSHSDELKRLDQSVMRQAIAKSCLCKARVVSEDEREGGVRAILNLGHTFGHAIETHMGYGNWLHGEAVAAGMVMAAELSRLHGWITQEEVIALKNLLKRFDLPTWHPGIGEVDFMSHMSLDKKVIGGQIRLVLLDRIGFARVTRDYDSLLLSQLLNASC